MKERKYFAACTAFEQSQRLDPQFGTQFYLAGCYAAIGKLASAWNLYRELARSDRHPMRRTQASDLATALAPRVPKLRLALEAAPNGVQVYMNGQSANALIGIDTPVDLGSYTIVAGAPGYRGWRRVVEVQQEASVTTVTIRLEPTTP